MGFNPPLSSLAWLIRRLMVPLFYGACLCTSATASHANAPLPAVKKTLLSSSASYPSPSEPSTVLNGVFSILPVYPTSCTGGAFVYSSKMVIPTGVVTINGNYTNQSPTVWNMTASYGLELHNLASGQNRSIESMVSRSSDGSISLKMPAGAFRAYRLFLSKAPITDSEPAADYFTADVAPANGEDCKPEISWDASAVKASSLETQKDRPFLLADRSIHGTETLKMLDTTSGPLYLPTTVNLTVSSSRTLSRGTDSALKLPLAPSATRTCTPVPHASRPAMYTLTVVAEIACPKPTIQTCSPTHQPDFTIEQWKAYNVDQFWANYVRHHTGGNLMANFWGKYIGVGQDEVACSADGSKQHCVLDDPCNTIKTPNPHEKVQAMFVSMAMINFASLITQVYATLTTVQNDMLEGGLTASWVNVFQPDPKAPSTTWTHILEVLSGLIVFFASFIIFFDPAWAPMAIGLMIGTSSVFGIAGNAGPLAISGPQYEFKLDAIENNTLVVENYVVTNQKTLTELFDGYYNNGQVGNHTVVDLFSGGAWVGSIPEPDPAFAGDGSTRTLATYFENIVIAGLTNTLMRQSVYILFVPYGVPYQDKPTFTEADCESDYIGPEATSGWIGSCTMGDPDYGQGMTVFMSSGEFHVVSWYNREFSYPYGGYKYNPLEVMEASITGFQTKGFNYNATQDIVSMLINDHNNTVIRNAITTLQPKTAGMFNIPVCRIEDFDALPHGGNHKKGTLQHIACTCLSDAANYTHPATGSVTYFRDSVSQSILTELQNAYGGPKNWCHYKSN